MNNQSVFASNMKNRRDELGLTQEELANKANLDLSCIARTERNENNPTLETIDKICDALNVDLSAMIIEGFFEKNNDFAICLYKNGRYKYISIDKTDRTKNNQRVHDFLESLYKNN